MLRRYTTLLVAAVLVGSQFAYIPPSEAGTRTWGETIRKSGILITPVGWHHLKYKEKTKHHNYPAVSKPRKGRKLIAVVVNVQNKSDKTFSFVSKDQVASFSYGNNRIANPIHMPNEYYLGGRCREGDYTRIHRNDEQRCVFLIEIPNNVTRLTASLPFPVPKSPGVWSLDISDKSADNYLGYEKRQLRAGWGDYQIFDLLYMYPVRWEKSSEVEIGDRVLVAGSGRSFFSIPFNLISIYQDSVFSGRSLSVKDPTGSFLTIVNPPTYSEECDTGVITLFRWCTLIFEGPSDLREVEVKYGNQGLEDPVFGRFHLAIQVSTTIQREVLIV